LIQWPRWRPSSRRRASYPFHALLQNSCRSRRARGRWRTLGSSYRVQQESRRRPRADLAHRHTSRPSRPRGCAAAGGNTKCAADSVLIPPIPLELVTDRSRQRSAAMNLGGATRRAGVTTTEFPRTAWG
jgi:hypothetical protein